MLYFIKTNSLLKCFDSVVINHVPRLDNQEENDLTHIISGFKVSKETLKELIEVKDKLVSTKISTTELLTLKLIWVEVFRDIPNLENSEIVEDFENFEVLAIDNMPDNDWQKPMVTYMESPTGMDNRKVKYKALSYMITGDKLFKKTTEGVLLKCIGESEAYLYISEFHRRSYGSHQEGHKMKWLLF